MTNISSKTQKALEKFLALLEEDFKGNWIDLKENFEHQIQDYEVIIKSSGKERSINLETDSFMVGDLYFNSFSLGLKEKSKQGALK